MNRHSPGRQPSQGESLLERVARSYDLAPRPLATRPAAKPAAIAEPVPASESASTPVPVEAGLVIPLRPAVPYRPAPHHQVSVDRDALAAHGLIDPQAPSSLLGEEFRAIKRPILLDAFGARGHEPVERGRMVLVGSARPGDGKSFSAVNLALSLAGEKDTAVLLVDADFAKPSVPRFLGLEPSEGLLDALRDPTADAERFVLDTDIAGLSVLPAGTPGQDDTELLTSNRADRVLDALMTADPRRLVVFDTPPVLAASPAAVLARHMGQVLFVVRADRTTQADVTDAIEAFGEDVRLHLMLNAVKFTAGGRRFGSYYGYGDRQ